MLAKLVIASLAISLWQLPLASGAITGLTLVVTPTSTQTAYGSNPSNVAVDVTFISTEADGEHLKLSANIVSVPAGQNVQATIAQVASSNATLEMFDSTSHIKAVNAGVVNAKFTVSIKSATSTPLAAGTYSILVFAGSNSGSQQQSISFVISPPPTPTLSPGLSRIWMTAGSTTANEANNASSISGSATVDMKNQTANLTVDLRDTNNSQISNLAITAAVTGPGVIGIGSNASTNNVMGRAVLGQAGQYSISVYADGTYGTSTISIYQNGQLIGSRSVIFTQPVAAPASMSISDISISAMTANAGDSVRVQFVSKTTSLATGQEAYVSINSYEDCEVEGCSVGGISNLVSGDSSNGTWLSTLTIPTTAISGEYTITIYFPKLKGVTGFYYRHPTRITVKGVDPTPPAPAPSIVLGQLTLNKNDFKIGETLIIRLPVKTSNLPTGVLLNATIFTADDCEESNCSSGGTGKLVSGSLQDGVWEIGIPIYQGMYSGTYSMNYGFFKLKGASGAISPLQSNIIKIVGLEPPPPPPPISVKISNISPKQTTINAGQTLYVNFEITSSNLDANQIVQAYLFPANADDSCEEGCGLELGKLISGSMSKGGWSASIQIPSYTPTGNYNLRVAFPKLKGIPGFYADYTGQIKVLGSTQPAINPYYTFSELRISTTQAKVGQSVEGYFSLKSNDDKISTPACIIDGVAGWSNASLISGSPMGGNWVCRVLIPSTAITGSYRLQVAVVGYANNNKNEEWADLGPIFVTGIPFLNVFYTIDATRISTSEAKVGQTIQGYFSLKTNDENVYTPECKLIGVSEWVRATRLSGTAMSGSWVCTVQVPTTAVSGLATFQVVVIGPANNNKNEERVSIGSVSIQGSVPAGTLTLAECKSAFASQQASLTQAIADISSVNKYLADPESFRDFFTVNSRRWSDALMLVTSIWNKNLTRTEATLVEIRSSKIQSCGGYAEFKGVFEKYAFEHESMIRNVKNQNSAIAQWYSNIQARIPDPQKYFNPQVEVGSIDIQSVSEKTLGIATISFAYQSNSGVAKIECTVSIGVCVVRDNGNSSSGETYFGVAEVRNFPSGSSINLSLRQYGPSGKMVASIQQPVSTLKPALQPKIGAVTSTLSGCTFKILNYDPAFNWFAKSEMRVLKDGTATINTLVPTDEYISTSRSGYQSVNALNTLFKCIPLSQTQTNGQDQIIEDDGVEEEPVGDLRVRKESSGKSLMTITSNLDTEKISIIATRKGKATIRFSATTNEAGSVQIRTSRNLSGYTLKLVFDGMTLKTAKVG